MSAIEVLKKEKELYLEKIKDINKANETRPEDIAEMYKKSIKTYEEFISALDEALLALEKQEEIKIQIGRIEECIEEFNSGGYFEENTLEEPSEFFIIDLKKVLDEMKRVLERVGEQK